MIARLSEGWAPDGWYPAAYYREDLQIRDQLEADVGILPADAAAAALAEVDARFAELTDDDGGKALTAETGPLSPGSSTRWWWHRIPRPLPWRGTPGR